MKNWVPLGASLLAALLTAGCASVPADKVAAGERSSNNMRFACGNGDKVEMQFFPDEGSSLLVRNGWTVALPAQATDTGYAYSNGPTTVRGQGDELTIQIGYLTPIWCRGRPMLVSGR
jgi:membrane-bound inhibitor of C-type lysozyme